MKKVLPIQIGKQQSCKSRTHFFKKLYALLSKEMNHNCNWDGSGTGPDPVPAVVLMFKSMKFNSRLFFDSFMYCYYLRDGSSSLASQLAGEFIVELRLHSTHLSDSGTHVKSPIQTTSDPRWIGSHPDENENEQKNLLNLCTNFSNQCCGSMTFWGGSGSGTADPCLWLMDPDPDPESGFCYFRHWPSRCQQKTNFLIQFFLLSTFWSYIYIIFQR
jgi:hypothetical protein